VAVEKGIHHMFLSCCGFIIDRPVGLCKSFFMSRPILAELEETCPNPTPSYRRLPMASLR